MSNGIEKTAKTVDEAVNMALLELNVKKDAVKIDVIDEGKSGFLGLIGNKLAKVRVSLLDNGDLGKTKYFVNSIIEKMGIEADIEYLETENDINVKISGDKVGLLIGRRGETLDALQYLTSLVVNKESDNRKKISIDVEDYRSRREETLINLADRLAKKVQRSRKSITLEPMTPYERRVIHATLKSKGIVDTFSVGDEPNRKVVIKPK